jgi:Ca-activated chloride channel family protein
VSGIIENGGTSLYDAVSAAHDALEANGDPKHIRAIVVLSDGQDHDSAMGLDELLSKLGSTGEESGNAIKVFTIAFGSDADQSVLKQIADISGGKQYAADPSSITKIYADIATFF